MLQDRFISLLLKYYYYYMVIYTELFIQFRWLSVFLFLKTHGNLFTLIAKKNYIFNQSLANYYTIKVWSKLKLNYNK